MVEEKKERSYLLVEFDDIGSTQFAIKLENVTLLQLLTLAEFLKFKATFGLQQQEFVQMEQAQQKRITVPTPKIEIAKK